MFVVPAVYLLAALLSFQTMTIEEKVGQIMMVHFRGEIGNEDARVLIEDLHVGGVVYYDWANGLRSPEQVQRLSADLQRWAKIPLLIAVDQEGGRVAPCKAWFTEALSQRDLGNTEQPELAKKIARIRGENLRAVGINTNFAPVIDIDTNPDNPVIGNRSFGRTPDQVIRFGSAALAGYAESGIFSTLKHFPGHGDTKVDSHLSLPCLEKSKEQLDAMELRPFRELVKKADLVMTAHLLVPALDPTHCSTLSEKTLAILRTEMGFLGPVISDSLIMEGILKQCLNVEEAALRAFNAGCDILLFGGHQLTEAAFELRPDDLIRIHKFLVKAVEDGAISENRLDEAVLRILELKAKSNQRRECGDDPERKSK